MKRKAQAEAELRAKVQASRGQARAAAAPAPGTRSPRPRKSPREIIKPYFYLERGYAFDSELFTIARDLVRLAEEKTKPNSERLEGVSRIRPQVARAEALLRGADLSRV